MFVYRQGWYPYGRIPGSWSQESCPYRVFGFGTWYLSLMDLYICLRQIWFLRAVYLGIFFQVLGPDTQLFYPPLGPDGTGFRTRVSGPREPALHIGKSDFSVYLPLHPHSFKGNTYKNGKEWR